MWIILLVRYFVNLIPFNLRLFINNTFPFLKLGKIFRHGKNPNKYIFQLKEFNKKFFLSDSIVLKKIFWEGIISYEKNLPFYFEKLSRNKKILELGANCGFYTCIGGKNSKKYYAFEPIRKNFEELKKNIKLNKLSNVKLFNFAVIDNNSKNVKLYIPKRDTTEINSGANLFFKSKKFEICKSINILKILNELKPNLIKMDIEGYEYYLLLKSEKYILKYKPIIICELNNKKTISFLISLNPKKIQDINGNKLNFKQIKYYKFRDCIFYF